MTELIAQECLRPGCAAYEIAVKQQALDNEVTRKLTEITNNQDKYTGNQEKIINAIGEIKLLLSNVNHLTEDFHDFRDQTRRALENVFSRLLGVEKDKASEADMKAAEESIKLKAEREDVNDMKKTGVSWLFSIIMAIFVGAIAFFFGVMRGMGK